MFRAKHVPGRGLGERAGMFLPGGEEIPLSFIATAPKARSEDRG